MKIGRKKESNQKYMRSGWSENKGVYFLTKIDCHM